MQALDFKYLGSKIVHSEKDFEFRKDLAWNRCKTWQDMVLKSFMTIEDKFVHIKSRAYSYVLFRHMNTQRFTHKKMLYKSDT